MHAYVLNMKVVYFCMLMMEQNLNFLIYFENENNERLANFLLIMALKLFLIEKVM